MRVILTAENLNKDCQGCKLQDENKVAAHILSFQLAEKFLKRFSGTWKIQANELRVNLQGLEKPLIFELNSGILAFGTLRTSITSRYSAQKGLLRLSEEIVSDLCFSLSEYHNYRDPLFELFVKLIEIFYARCGLNILSVEKNNKLVGWELYLCEAGPSGWIGTDGIVENRFGERVDLKSWSALRPEKIAAYVFGFNRFCQKYPSPFKTLAHYSEISAGEGEKRQLRS